SNDEESVSVTTFGIPEVIILTRTEQEPDVFEAVSEIITTSADTLLLKANDGFSSYQWERKKPDETIWTSLTSGQTYTPSSKNTFEYRVTVVDPNGCGTPETNNEIVLVDAYDLSLISINNQTEGMCYSSETVPLSITLKNSGQDVYPISTEITVVANTPMGNQNETIILDTQLGIGEVLEYEFPERVSLPIGESFLSFSVSTDKDPVTSNNELSITTTVSPTPTVSIEPSILYKVFDQYEVYEIVPTYSEPYTEEDTYTYSWHDGTTDSTYLVYNPSDFPVYEVTVENSFGCSASSSMTIISADLQVASIASPSTDCGLTDDTPVTISIKNNGNTTYTTGTDIDVDLYLDGALITTETITLAENFVAKSTKDFTLNQTLDLSTVSNATIQVEISTAAEEVDYDNNTRNKSVYALGFPSPNLGADRDIYAWQEELDPGYYDAYIWNDASVERELIATENGTYSVTVTDFSGCQGSDVVTLTFYKDDIELLEVLEPTTGCGLTDQEPITFRIKNNGNYPIPVGREIEVGYTHNGNDYPDSYTLTEEVAVDGVFEVTLPQTIDLSQPKGHSVLFWIDMVNDGFDNNNSITLNMNSYPKVNLSLNVATGTVSYNPVLLDVGATYNAYQWQFEGVDVTGNQTYTATQSGTYSVLVTDGNGCQGYAEVDLTILMPDYGITQLVSPKSDCELADNQVVTVEITNQGNDILETGNIITLSLWQNGNLLVTENFTASQNLEPGASIEHTLNHRVNLSAKNQHAIAVKAKHPLDNNPANDSLMQEVVAYGFPTVDLGSDRVVKTASAVLDAGEGFATYLWSNGSIERTLTISETGVYSVQVTDANGCSATDEVSITFITSDYQISLLSPVSACSLSDAETVKISITNMGIETLPMGSKIGLTFGIDGKNIANETLTVSAKLEPQQSVDYTFNKKADLSQNKIYAFSATLEYSLDQDPSNNTTSVNVEHYKLPVVNLGENRTSYGPLTLDAGGGFVSYLWSDGSTTRTLLVTQSGTYWVKVIDDNGCEGTDEVILEIKDFSKLTISEVLSPLEKDCKKDEIPVSIIVTNGRGTTIAKNKEIELNYQVNGGSVVSEELELSEAFESGSKITFEFEKGLELGMDSYTIKYWVSYEGALGEPFMQNITINPSPAVNLGDDLDVTFPYTIISGLTGLDFLWSTGETTSKITVDSPGSYWLTVTNEFGCQASDTVVLTLTSVHQIPGSGTVVTVYPNPADQWITINVEPRQPALFTVELISQAGQVVYSKNITQNQPFTHRVDVNKFTPGVYLLRVSSGGEWVTVKVVIQR
ncbi:MAG: T9SS type A sorting domain-containing protein, partial [Tenuifilaceae bacterium]|nr:T9SS type A sorting domain-containing protein [Tenuifilaceae bacterium]